MLNQLTYLSWSCLTLLVLCEQSDYRNSLCGFCELILNLRKFTDQKETGR